MKVDVWTRQAGRWRTIAALLGALLATPALAQTTVTIDTGPLEGTLADGIASYRGIPYAAAPVGDLRWRAPQPAEPWTGMLDASRYGDDCSQPIVSIAVAGEANRASEDCLTLNVWTPAEAEGPLPVLVWIHGGGFLMGSGSAPIYDGSALAAEGIVVVTINYRLGAFGFFTHPALLAAGEGPVGNFGLMDQLAALQWVQRNIAAFGGDPTRVTLAGELAGGASVVTWITSPAAEGLFAQAIVMSGGGRRGLLTRPTSGGTITRPSADLVDLAVAAGLGVFGSSAAALAELRALPADAITTVSSLGLALMAALLQEDATLPGTPIADGTLIAGDPSQAFAAGTAATMPIMIGTTAVDLPLHFPPREDPLSLFGADRAAAGLAYNPAGAVNPDPTLLALAVGMDMTMHEPARYLARAETAAGAPVWLYRFTYVGQSGRPSPGAVHGTEVPFLFHTLEDGLPGAATDEDLAIADAFSTYVANFVRYGDPNGDRLPAWPLFNPARFDLMHFTMNNGPVFGPDPRADRIAAVERAMDAPSGSR